MWVNKGNLTTLTQHKWIEDGILNSLSVTPKEHRRIHATSGRCAPWAALRGDNKGEKENDNMNRADPPVVFEFKETIDGRVRHYEFTGQVHQIVEIAKAMTARDGLSPIRRAINIVLVLFGCALMNYGCCR